MYYFLKYLAWIVASLTLDFRRRGLQNIPARGPLLVVANHMSVIDPVLLGIGLRRRVVFLAKEELFKNPFSAFIVSRFGAIPVYRGKFNREALNEAAKVLSTGGVLALFPEGRRSTTARINAAHPGSALIAYHNRVPVLPVGIAGSEVARGIGWIKSRPRVVIKAGPPFLLPESRKSLNRDQLNQYTDLIMQNIIKLVPEQYHGEYARNKVNDENQDNQT